MKSLKEVVEKNGFQKGCYRYIKNYYNRKCTLKNKVVNILNNYEFVYFCTYTISDEYINSSIDFLRVLKKILNGFDYILNEDFGSINSRLHYHVLLGFNDFKSYDSFSWSYGFCYFEKVYNVNVVAMANYINKLSNHTRKNKVIYSRKGKNEKSNISC